MQIFSRDLDDHPADDIQGQVESLAQFINAYVKDCDSAYRFGMNPDKEAEWGLIQVGCALANLTLVQSDLISDKRPWFKTYGRWCGNERVLYTFLRADDYMRFL